MLTIILKSGTRSSWLASSLNRVPATTYFYLPIDDEEEEVLGADDLPSHPKYIDWCPSRESFDDSQEPLDLLEPSNSLPSLCLPAAVRPSTPTTRHKVNRQSNNISILEEVLSENDLYKILGINCHFGDPKKYALRRAYLSRSKAYHPDKFSGDPDATRAFQKFSVAYDILSHTSTKKRYDSKSAAQRQQFDFYPTQSHAEQTLRSVLLGVLNDFLEADLEVVRTFLRKLNDLNHTLRLEEENINSILLTLHSVRERALTCKTCIIALHTELLQLLELQAAFRKLPILDVVPRSRLTVQFVKITVGLPLKVEEALISESRCRNTSLRKPNTTTTFVFPTKVCSLIRSVVVLLEKIETVLS